MSAGFTRDLLEKNPDLKSRVDKLGTQVGLTGGAQTMTGTRRKRRAWVAAGPPDIVYSVIGQAQSSAIGTMHTILKVPGDRQRGQVLVFSVAPGTSVAAWTGWFVVRN